MAALFVLGMGVFVTGLCCLASRCVARTLGTTPEDDGDPIGSRSIHSPVFMPDTVPLEWVKAYQGESDV